MWIWPDRSPSMTFTSLLVDDSKLDRALVVAFALAEVLVEGGERVGIPGLMRPTASRNVIDKMAAGDPARHDRAREPAAVALRPLRWPEIVLLSDLWARSSEVQRTIAQLVGHRRAWPCHADRRSGGGNLSLFGPGRIHRTGRRRRITAGRAEAWRNDYQARVERHRAEIRAETDRLGWSFAIHRTDRPASELLLACIRAWARRHAAGVARGTHGSPEERRMIGGLRSGLRSRWCCSACSACRCCGGCCG